MKVLIIEFVDENSEYFMKFGGFVILYVINGFEWFIWDFI